MDNAAMNEARHRITSQVWAGLDKGRRQQAIRLLAQLAFNLVVSQTGQPRSQEHGHANPHASQG